MKPAPELYCSLDPLTPDKHVHNNDSTERLELFKSQACFLAGAQSEMRAETRIDKGEIACE